jgi:prevent-host-death family protein
MRSVGIRELRQRASDLLRLVQVRETVEVTDRGRPVALLSPIPDLSPLDRLRAAGEVSEAEGTIDDPPEPIEPVPGMPLSSEILATMRGDER